MKDKDSRELSPHLQLPPPPDQMMSLYDKIFLSLAFGGALIGLIIWAVGIWFVGLNPAG